MNNTFSLLFALLILTAACHTKPNTNSKPPFKEHFDCSLGLMLRAYNEHGADEEVPVINDLDDKFIVVVDSSQKETNFISFGEVRDE